MTRKCKIEILVSVAACDAVLVAMNNFGIRRFCRASPPISQSVSPVVDDATFTIADILGAFAVHGTIHHTRQNQNGEDPSLTYEETCDCDCAADK